MTTKWKEYENKPKDDLIIELVKAEHKIDCVCAVLKELADIKFKDYTWTEGEVPNEAWTKKIIEHATRGLNPDEYTTCNFEEYGILEKKADEIYDRVNEFDFRES